MFRTHGVRRHCRCIFRQNCCHNFVSFLRPCGLQVCDFTSVMYVPSFPLLLLTNTTEKVLKAWLQKLARWILYREYAWVKLQYFIIIVPEELLLKWWTVFHIQYILEILGFRTELVHVRNLKYYSDAIHLHYTRLKEIPQHPYSKTRYDTTYKSIWINDFTPSETVMVVKGNLWDTVLHVGYIGYMSLRKAYLCFYRT